MIMVLWLQDQLRQIQSQRRKRKQLGIFESPPQYTWTNMCHILSDVPVPQFRVDIKKAPIAEEGAEADAVLANIASTLRTVCSNSNQCRPCLLLKASSYCEKAWNSQRAQGCKKYNLRSVNPNSRRICKQCSFSWYPTFELITVYWYQNGPQSHSS